MKSKNLQKYSYTFMMLGLLAVVLLFFTITKGGAFWKGDVWRGMALQFPEYGVVALGMMFCFICGKMDMSIMALGDFATIMAVRYMIAHADNPVGGILVGILIALAIAAVGGVINGILVRMLDIPPVMATISMQLVWTGLSVGLTGGNAVKGLPSLYTEIGHVNVLGFIPMPLVVFLVVFAICWFLLNKTVYGKKLYMVGTNIKAARFSAQMSTIRSKVSGRWCWPEMWGVITRLGSPQRGLSAGRGSGSVTSTAAAAILSCSSAKRAVVQKNA